MARPIFSMDDVLSYSDNDSDVEEKETEKCGDEHEVEQEEETNIKHTSKRSWVWSRVGLVRSGPVRSQKDRSFSLDRTGPGPDRFYI